MTTSTTPVTRRAALTGLGAGSLGLVLATTSRQVSAQDTTPAARAGHPILGTWVIVRDSTNTTEVPVVVVFTDEGSFIDAAQGVAGAWEPTGPNSAAMTIIPFLDPAGGYAVVRGTWEVDEGGDTMSGPATVTILGPDGAVVATDTLDSRATRFKVEPMENTGKAITGFPTWTQATPTAATPTA